MRKIILISILLSLLFVVNSCRSEEIVELQGYKIGDKFTLQEYGRIDIARADKDVVVYRLWTISRYYYYSTTRKDSIIYRLHSNVNR